MLQLTNGLDVVMYVPPILWESVLGILRGMRSNQLTGDRRSPSSLHRYVRPAVDALSMLIFIVGVHI